MSAGAKKKRKSAAKAVSCFARFLLRYSSYFIIYCTLLMTPLIVLSALPAFFLMFLLLRIIGAANYAGNCADRHTGDHTFDHTRARSHANTSVSLCGLIFSTCIVFTPVIYW